MKIILITLFALITTALAQTTDQKLVIETVTPIQLSELLKAKDAPQIIDVRTKEEFKAGHIEGAKNIDIKSADFKKILATLDRDKAYIVHCKSGGRSTKSIQFWKELGFTKIYHLDSGFDGWKKADFLIAE